MKVALLSTFYPYRGGIAQFGAQLYRAVEETSEVKAFTFTRQYPSLLFPGKTQLVEAEDDADKIPAERTLDSINPISYRSTAKAINSYRPDVLISQYWMPFLGPAIGGVHKRIDRSIKRISIIHNIIPHEKRFFDDAANGMFARHNEGFVVLSDQVQNDLRQLLPEAKILKLDHPVYNHFGEKKEKEIACQELGLDVHRKYALFFGFIRDYKGLDLLIDAFKQLPNDIELIVAGEVYGSFDKYERQLESSGLNDRIHLFTRYISDHEVPSFFSAADVCVLPYKSATQSGIIGIADHFDLPVVATDVGGLKENVEDGKTGMIIPVVDADAIAEGIRVFFSDDRRFDFQQGIQLRKQEKSWEKFTEQILAFSKEI